MDTNGMSGGPGGAASAPPSHRGRARSPWLRAWFWCERAWQDFLHLVMPADCVACGSQDHTLCPACSAVLRRQTVQPFRAERFANALVGVSGESYLPVLAAGPYRDALAAAILGFKNHGRTELSAPLCRCLARVLDRVPGQPAHLPRGSPAQPAPVLWLVPVPSTGSGWRRRGYDPVAMLIKALVAEGRLPPGMVVAPILGVKMKAPWRRHHQKGLGRAARRSNVRNTMKIRHCRGRGIRPLANPNGQAVLLLDDVLTTGSTLQEAAKTLEMAGFLVHGAVVLAAARAPDGDGGREC